jgi:hypothetical protein
MNEYIYIYIYMYIYIYIYMCIYIYVYPCTKNSARPRKLWHATWSQCVKNSLKIITTRTNKCTQNLLCAFLGSNFNNWIVIHGRKSVNFAGNFWAKYYPYYIKGIVVLSKQHRFAALYVETFIYISKKFVSVLCFQTWNAECFLRFVKGARFPFI